MWPSPGDQQESGPGGPQRYHVLVAVSLAGVSLPCLVTAFTVAREVSPKWALTITVRQAGAAIGFAIVIAWSGSLLLG